MVAWISILALSTLTASPVAHATTYQQQINALNAQINEQQNAAAAAHEQVNTIGGQVALLNAQIASVQAQLALVRTKQAQTTQSIAEAQAEMAKKKAQLNESVRNIYQQNQVTSIEMLASSNSFSDYIDKQQYSDRIKDHVQDAHEQVNALKVQLEKQKLDLDIQASQAAGLSATLATQRNQQAELLALAQGNEAEANAGIRAKNSKVKELERQQAAALAAASVSYSGSIPGASGGSGGSCDNGHGNGGYPMKWCNAPQDSMVDNWGMYSRECVSYAAWKRSAIGRPIPGGWGNANQWDDRARSAGYRVDSVPEVGAIAQTNAGPYGHVGIVEAVEGNRVIISEMNYDVQGHFRLGAYSVSYYQYIH